MLTTADIVSATGGRLLQGRVKQKFKGVAIDSRSFKSGYLFVAIKGDKFDGHDFIDSIVKKHAAGIVVARKLSVKVPDNVVVILVQDTTKALGHIARYVRLRAKVPVVAITGSSGKTTTKEMVAAILGSRYKVLKNTGTQNNHIGVPLTLLQLKKTHQVVVVECGTNQFGDIPWLADVCHPDIVIFTNIGQTHLERLKTPGGVFREKFSLTKYLTSKGAVVTNYDDPYLGKLTQTPKRWRVVSYGHKAGARIRATDIQLKNNNTVSFQVNRVKDWTLKTPARHNIDNALAAVACGQLLHVNFNQMKKILARFQFPSGRQTLCRINGSLVINDTYNANPSSFRSAVKTLADFKISGRKIIVCADMLELGAKSPQIHRQLGEFIGEFGFDLVLTFGEGARMIKEGAQAKNSVLAVHHNRSLKELHERLKDFYRPGDAILVKGSRGMHMERTIEFLSKTLS